MQKQQIKNLSPVPAEPWNGCEESNRLLIGQSAVVEIQHWQGLSLKSLSLHATQLTSHTRLLSSSLHLPQLFLQMEGFSNSKMPYFLPAPLKQEAAILCSQTLGGYGC